MEPNTGPDYPIILFDWEYELILSRKKRLHLHDWVWRRMTLPEKLEIVGTEERNVYTQFPSGRYCLKCGCVDFQLGKRTERHTGARWNQNDMNYLLGALIAPEATSDVPSEPR
jgi:hypothetical protein